MRNETRAAELEILDFLFEISMSPGQIWGELLEQHLVDMGVEASHYRKALINLKSRRDVKGQGYGSRLAYYITPLGEKEREKIEWETIVVALRILKIAGQNVPIRLDRLLTQVQNKIPGVTHTYFLRKFLDPSQPPKKKGWIQHIGKDYSGSEFDEISINDKGLEALDNIDKYGLHEPCPSVSPVTTQDLSSEDATAIKNSKVSIFLLKHPLNVGGKEEYVNLLKIPSDNRVLLYFAVKLLDNKEYNNPRLTISFPKTFSVDYDSSYPDLSYGKDVLPCKQNEVTLVAHLIGKKDRIDKIRFPVVINTPKKRGTYVIDVSLVCDNLDGMYEEQLRLTVVDKDAVDSAESFRESSYLLRERAHGLPEAILSMLGTLVSIASFFFPEVFSSVFNSYKIMNLIDIRPFLLATLLPTCFYWVWEGTAKKRIEGHVKGWLWLFFYGSVFTATPVSVSIPLWFLEKPTFLNLMASFLVVLLIWWAATLRILYFLINYYSTQGVSVRPKINRILGEDRIFRIKMLKFLVSHRFADDEIDAMRVSSNHSLKILALVLLFLGAYSIARSMVAL